MRPGAGASCRHASQRPALPGFPAASLHSPCGVVRRSVSEPGLNPLRFTYARCPLQTDVRVTENRPGFSDAGRRPGVETASRAIATDDMSRRQDRVWVRACCQSHAYCGMSGSRCGSAIHGGTRCMSGSAGGACAPVADAGCDNSRTRRSAQDWVRQAPRVTAPRSARRRQPR